MTVEEIIARAVYAALPDFGMERRPTTSTSPAYEMVRVDDLWEVATGRHKQCREQAASVIAALETAGYVVVPKEPTREMCVAGQRDLNDNIDSAADTAYRAMIEARPK